jgi:hypothetical protein
VGVVVSHNEGGGSHVIQVWVVALQEINDSIRFEQDIL